jgi:hypothetical protein
MISFFRALVARHVHALLAWVKIFAQGAGGGKMKPPKSAAYTLRNKSLHQAPSHQIFDKYYERTH